MKISYFYSFLILRSFQMLFFSIHFIHIITISHYSSINWLIIFSIFWSNFLYFQNLLSFVITVIWTNILLLACPQDTWIRFIHCCLILCSDIWSGWVIIHCLLLLLPKHNIVMYRRLVRRANIIIDESILRWRRSLGVVV